MPVKETSKKVKPVLNIEFLSHGTLEVDDIDLLNMDDAWRMNRYDYGTIIYIGDEEATNVFSSN